MSHDALRQLRALHWLPASSPLLSPPLLDWLLEEDSMTRRFEQHCQQVTVQLLREAFITADEMPQEAAFCLPTRVSGCVKSCCAVTMNPADWPNRGAGEHAERPGTDAAKSRHAATGTLPVFLLDAEP